MHGVHHLKRKCASVIQDLHLHPGTISQHLHSVAILSGVELVVHRLPHVKAKPGVHILYLITAYAMHIHLYQPVVSVLLEAITACLITHYVPMADSQQL